MGFDYKKFKRALDKQIKKYKGVVKARVTGQGRTVTSSSSSCTDLSAACKGLSNIIDDFKGLDSDVDTSEVMYASAQVERRIADAIGQVAGADKEVQKVTQEAARVSKRLKDKNLYTSYPNVYKKKIKAFKNAYSKILKDISAEGGIQFSSDRMKEVQSHLDSSFKETHSLIEKAMSFGLDSQKQITGETKKLADYIEASLEKQLKDILSLSSSVNKELSAAHHLKDASIDGSKTAVDSSKEFLGNMERIKNQLMRRDFLAVAKSVSGMKKPKSKPPGTDALSKAVKGMSKSMGFMGILQLVIEAIKQGVGLLLGVNNKAAEFNKELSEVHGLVSQGYDVNMSVDTNDIPKQLKKYQEMILSYGADSGTFVSPKEILSITGAFEGQGVKLKQITGNADQFGTMMQDVLGYSLQSGMSYTEMASIMGDWQQNFNMNSGLVKAQLDNFMLAQEDTGMPARLLMDTVLAANFDYSMWGDSMNTALELQKKNLKRGVSTIAAGKKGIEALFDLFNNTKPINFAYMLGELPVGKFNEMIEADIQRVKKNMSMAPTPEEKAKFQYMLQKLEGLKKIDKGHAMQKYFGTSIGSAESKGTLMKESLLAKFGPGIKQVLKDKVMSTDMEYELKFFLGQDGASESQWAAIMSGLDLLVNEDVDLGKAADGIRKAQEDRAKQEELRKKLLAATMPQLKTLDDIKEAMWNKIMVQVIKAADGIIKWLAGLLSTNILGGDTNQGDEARQAAAKADLLEACGRVSQMEKGKDRDKAVEELRNQIGAAKAAGVDLSEVATTLASKGVATDILQRIMDAGNNSDFSVGGTLTLDPRWIQQIKKMNPTEAATIIAALQSAASQTGVPADLLAGTMFAETAMGSNKRASSAGALGPMQFMPETAKEVARVSGLDYGKLTSEYMTSVLGSAMYRKSQMKQIGGNIKSWSNAEKQKAAYASYNMGAGNFQYYFKVATNTLGYAPKNWSDMLKGAKIPHETVGYVAKITKALSNYGSGNCSLPTHVPPPPKQEDKDNNANPALPVAGQANKLANSIASSATNVSETHNYSQNAASNAQVLSAVT